MKKPLCLCRGQPQLYAVPDLRKAPFRPIGSPQSDDLPSFDVAHPMRRRIDGGVIVSKRPAHSPAPMMFKGGVRQGQRFSTEGAAAVLPEPHQLHPARIFNVSGFGVLAHFADHLPQGIFVDPHRSIQDGLIAQRGSGAGAGFRDGAAADHCGSLAPWASFQCAISSAASHASKSPASSCGTSL